MLAHRVVLKRGLKIEPEEWLATVDEKDFYNWEAYSRLEPWWGQREMLARVVHQLSLLLAAKVGGDEASNFIVHMKDLMPSDWAFRPEDKEVDSIADAQAKLEQRYA